ncbi:hypothetical protein HDU76_002775, partial [Blyttiomyces sp. JEL0837]
VNAFRKLQARPLSYQYEDVNKISYYDFTATHTANAYWAHVNQQFLVYHRAMLWTMDKALETVNWYGGMVYFDWSAKSQNWQNSDLFDYFGPVQGNGSPNYCVLDFKASNDSYSSGPGKPRDGKPACLQRLGGGVFVDATTINTIYNTATNFVMMQGHDESNYHATGHGVFGGGGDMGNPYFSPNDMLFYYFEGTIRNGDPIAVNSPGTSGTAVSKFEKIDSWNSQWTAGDMLDTTGNVLCYTYSKSAGDLPMSPPACPSDSGSSTTDTPPPSTSIDTAALEKTWFSDAIRGLLQVGGIQFTSGGSPVHIQRREAYLNITATGSASGNNSATPTILYSDDTTPTSTTSATTATITPAPEETPMSHSHSKNSGLPLEYTTSQTVDEATNETTVNVHVGNKTFSIPTGFEIYRVFQNKVIAVKEGLAANYTHDGEAIAQLPMSERPYRVVYEDKPIPVYVRPAHLYPAPEKPDGYNLTYPTMLTEEGVKAWHMDYPSYIESYYKVMRQIDECNADPKCTSPSVQAPQA